MDFVPWLASSEEELRSLHVPGEPSTLALQYWGPVPHNSPALRWYTTIKQANKQISKQAPIRQDNLPEQCGDLHGPKVTKQSKMGAQLFCYSHTAKTSGQFARSFLANQRLSDSLNPVYLTKNWTLLPLPHCLRLLSTSHSSWPSTRIGSGTASPSPPPAM